MDVTSGAMVWQKHLKWSSDKPQEAGEGRGFICTNALTATPVVTPAGEGERSLYVITNDGYLHILGLENGDEKDPPVQMLPGIYGKAYGLNLVDKVVYTITGQGCGGVPNAALCIQHRHQKSDFLFASAGRTLGSGGSGYRHGRNDLL